MKKLSSTFLAIIILLFVTIIFFHRILFFGEIFVTPAAGLGDITLGEFPYWQFLSNAYQHYRIPLWTDFFNGGTSLISFPSTHLFFPVTLISLYFFKIPFAFTIVVVAYVFLLGFLTYLFCRTIGLSTNAALFCGAIFSYAAPITARIMHAQFIVVIALFVAVLLCIEKLLQTKKQRYIFLLAGAFALQIHASHPQITLYSLLITICYFVLRLFFLKETIKQKVSLMAGFVIAGVVALGMSAIVLIPNLEFYALSTRAKGIQATLGDYPYSLIELILFVMPFAFGNPAAASYNPPFQEPRLFWESTSYIGLIPLALSIPGFFAARKNKYALIFAILFVLSITLSLGEKTPFGFLLSLPPFSSFRIPSRFLIFGSFSLVILAGFALDTLLQKLKSKRTIISMLLIAVAVFDLYTFCYSFNVLDKASEWIKTPETARFIKMEEAEELKALNETGGLKALSKTEGFFRIYSIEATDFNTNPYNQVFVQTGGWLTDIAAHRFLFNWLPANTNMLFNIKSANGYASLSLARFEEVENEILTGINADKSSVKLSKASLKLLSLFGTKYLISPFEVTESPLTLRYTTENRYNLKFRVYENNDFVPNALLLTDVKVMKAEGIVKEMEKDSFDPHRTVILEKGQKFALAESPEELLLRRANNSSEGTGTIVTLDKKNSGQEIFLKTDSQVPSYLLLTDIYYPGWHAYVDGKETEILQADYLFRAVPLQAGNHTVRFIYKPTSFLIGALITLFTITTIIVYGGLYAVYRLR